jgi:hypothetical protein
MRVLSQSGRRWLGAALFAVALPLPVGRGRAAEIDQLQVDAHGRQFDVAFRLAGAFTEEVEEVIASGLPVTFHHTIRAYHRRTAWIDQLVAEKVITTTVNFDTLTKQYHMSRSVDDQLVDTLLTDKPAEMKSWMTVIEKIDLPRDSESEPLDRYYVKVKSEIQKRFVFFFIPWDFETPWMRSAVIRPDGALKP